MEVFWYKRSIKLRNMEILFDCFEMYHKNLWLNEQTSSQHSGSAAEGNLKVIGNIVLFLFPPAALRGALLLSLHS